MQTILLYLLIMAVVVAVVFAVVWFVFGRSEELPPLEPDATLTTLPSSAVTGNDVRALRFAQTFRGYKAAEVDWALARLAAEIDDLRGVLTDLHNRHERAWPAGETSIGDSDPTSTAPPGHHAPPGPGAVSASRPDGSEQVGGADSSHS